MIKVKRAYEPARKQDGYRVLIDRLWPRGVRKEELEIDEWAKELAPSTELRKAFGHDPSKWREFQSRYRKELRSPVAQEKIRELAGRAARGTVTLVYSAHDEKHNNAVVLASLLNRMNGGKAKRQRRKAAEK